jgi:hypothetical protein
LMAVRLVCCINHNALRKTSELFLSMIMHQKTQVILIFLSILIHTWWLWSRITWRTPQGFEHRVLLKRKCVESIAFYQSCTAQLPF